MLHNVLLWGLDILNHLLPTYTSGILANPCHSWKTMLQQSKKSTSVLCIWTYIFKNEVFGIKILLKNDWCPFTSH